jgi:hypothetical protein
VYELPTELASEHAYHPFYKRHDSVYTAYQKFMGYFSSGAPLGPGRAATCLLF